MSVVRKLEGSFWPVLIALAVIALVMVVLFANPLASAALALAVPFIGIGVLAAVLLGMNLRWKLWQGTRPLFFSIADLGFLLCFAAFGVYGFAFLADAWTNFPYVIVGFVVVGLTRIAFLEFEAWWLGVLLCAGLALVFGPYVVFSLREPAWFFDFTASLLLASGIALLVCGSVLSLLESPARTRRERWPGWLKAAGVASALFLGALTAFSGFVTLSESQDVEASAVLEFVFDGGRIEEPNVAWRSGVHSIVVRNDDLRVHTLSSVELGIDIVVGPRSSASVDVELPAGSHGFECRVPGHLERLSFSVQ